MSPYEILFIAGLAIVLPIAVWIITKAEVTGSPLIAAALAGAFAGYTGVTIAAEGVMQVIINHTNNLWGVQVWWDLLISVALCLFLVAPRAREVGMNLPLWTLFVVSTASIGLLAMLARLFWLEQQTKSVS